MFTWSRDDQTSGGSPSFGRFWINPKYELTLERATDITSVASLFQCAVSRIAGFICKLKLDFPIYPRTLLYFEKEWSTNQAQTRWRPAGHIESPFSESGYLKLGSLLQHTFLCPQLILLEHEDSSLYPAGRILLLPSGRWRVLRRAVATISIV